MEVSESILAAAFGTVFGAGGLGGLLTLLGKSRDSDAAAVRQYYTQITERMERLETTVTKLEAENAMLHLENAKLHAERITLRAEIDALRTRVEELANTSEAHE